MKKVSKVLWGLVILALGTIGILNQLDITHINIFFDGWWTLFIIVPCAIGLVEGDDVAGALIGLAIGILLLLICQDIISFAIVWKLILPLILVIVGASIIVSALCGTKNKVIKNDVKGNSIAAVLKEELRSIEDKFDGGTIDAVFGHAIVDTRKAKYGKEATLKISSIFGSVDLFVPEDVTVQVKSTKVFGSVNSNSYKDTEGNSKTLYVEATSVFGGINIK